MQTLTPGTYFGRKRAENHDGPLRLSEYDYTVPRTAWHYHENPYFMYILQGNVYDVDRRQKRQCYEGCLLLHNWDEPHYNELASANVRGFHIETDRGWYDKLSLDLPCGSLQVYDPKVHGILFSIYQEFHASDHYSTLSIEVLMTNLLETLHKDSLSGQAAPPWLGLLKELVHYEMQPLSLEYLSDKLGVHPVHISRSVPKYFGNSLGEYIRQVRIGKSLPYLLQPDYSLAQIAYACGFSDQSHYTRVFRRLMGQTPGQARKKMHDR